MPTNQTHRQAFERDTIPKPVGLGCRNACCPAVVPALSR
jgi:hypothetical protein